MTRDERRLARHIAIAVAVKLVALTLLWWVFVRDMPVAADPQQTAAHLGISASPPGTTQ
jgi:hypothetical protein